MEHIEYIQNIKSLQKFNCDDGNVAEQMYKLIESHTSLL